MIDVWSAEFQALVIAVAMGAFVQASIGFGFALISAPVLSLIAPEAVPATLLILSAPVNLYVGARERASIDRPGAARVTAGLVPGTVAAVAILAVLPEDLLIVAFGVAIVLAAGASALRPHARFGPAAHLGGGAVSGLVNTVAGTGGPFLALLYQHRPGPVLRSTLAVTFTASVVLSLIGQGAAGRLSTDQVVLAAQMTPALGLGLWASRFGARVADAGWLRAAVLVFSAASGTAAIVKGLV